MKAIWMLRSLRFGALLIFLCTFIRFVSNCEVTDDVLISFPMYPIFILFDALNEKLVASVLFSLLVNLIFWLPINKVYHSIYGILVIERCKAFFMVIGYIFVFMGATLFQRSYLGEGWGLLISVGYFAWLQYGLKAFDNAEFLSYTGIKAPVEESPRSYIVVGIIHCVVYLTLAAELHAPDDNARLFVKEIETPNSIAKDISLDGKSALLVAKSRAIGTYPLREKREISIIDLEKILDV